MRMSSGWRTVSAMILLPAALAACSSVPVDEATALGSVDVALVSPPPGATRLQLDPGQRFIYPDLVEPVPMPEYPEELLALRLEPLELCVDVVIAETGSVSLARRRIDAECPGEAGPHEARFEQVLQDAVLQWTYEPALVCSTPDGRASEDACAEPDAVETPVALRLSYAFGFIQEDGRPNVEMHGAPRSGR